MNILIADDDRNFGLVMKTELEADTHSVDLVHDGVDAVLAFLIGLYDVVLLDVSMPRLDGADALKIMKRLRPDLISILVSGNSSLIDPRERDAMAGRGTVFFQKPFEMDEIRGFIRGVKDGRELPLREKI